MKTAEIIKEVNIGEVVLRICRAERDRILILDREGNYVGSIFFKGISKLREWEDGAVTISLENPSVIFTGEWTKKIYDELQKVVE
jgi:hypothetical protein